MTLAGRRFVTLDVFTDRRFGGNPLAVFPDAAGLDDATMQALAREIGYSETTFVLPPADPANDARVRIFTPRLELPFAGHPNVGTGWVLAERARDGVLRFEEAAGLVEVRIARDAAGAVAQATIAAPRPLSIGEAVAPMLAAPCAGLDPWEIATEAHPPLLASCGNPFVVAEVAPAALSRAAPDAAAFRQAAARAPALAERFALYLYAREGAGLRARMFSPALGMAEDPATGSAAVALAGLLLHLAPGRAASAAFDIVQGAEMGRPSLMRAAAHRTPGGIRATVGGACVPVFRGEVLA